MKNWKRITLVSFVLIGGAMSFGYWVINQLDSALNNLSASYLANIHSVYPVRGNAPNGVYPPQDGSASTSPEISGELATSTGSESASTSRETSVVLATFADQKLSFTFPPKDTEVYIGCTYPISWQPSTMISSLETALIDVGTRKAVGPRTSGLAKENTIGRDLQNLEWKVGAVWPGEYFISISNVNGLATDERSRKFRVNEMPDGSDKKEQKNLCEETGGNLF